MTDPTSRTRDDEEHDPTGVRDLLSGLPDPGPMPQDLVRRIEARLEVEQAHRAAPVHPLGSHADRVVDLAAERSARRPGRTLTLLGAAAAGLVVTTVALTQVLGDGTTSSDTAAQYPSRAASVGDDGAGADSAAEAEDLAGAGSGAGEDTDAQDEAAPAADGSSLGEVAAVDITLLPDLGRVGPDDYAARIHEASTDEVSGGVDPSAPLTQGGAASCWGTISADDDWSTRYAASASYLSPEGGLDEVVVLLGLHADGDGRSWVVPADCTVDPEVAPLESAGRAVNRR